MSATRDLPNGGCAQTGGNNNLEAESPPTWSRAKLTDYGNPNTEYLALWRIGCLGIIAWGQLANSTNLVDY
jgi:hypothetical protein